MQTKLLNVFFDSVAHQYYPAGLHESDEQYQKTGEHQNFLRLHSRFEKIKILAEPFFKGIENEFGDYPAVHNGSTTHYPVYELEFYLGVKGTVKEFLSVYISFMIPFYHLAYLTFNTESARILDEQNRYHKTEAKLSQLLKDQLGYEKFPQELIKQPVPGLVVWENFNYLNAFFTDFYRITHQQ